MELGNEKRPQLYNLDTDPGEKENIADKYKSIVQELSAILMNEKNKK